MESTAKSGRARDTWTFVAIVLLAFGLRFVYLLQARACPMFDGLVVDGLAYGTWSDKIAAGDWAGEGVFYQAPLYPYFLAVVKLVVGHELWNIRVVQIAIGSLACGVLFLAGRRFFSRRAGIAAGLMLALYPSAIFFDGTIQKTVLGGLFMTLLLLALARGRERASFGRWLVVGVVLGLLMLTREETILLVPVIAAWGFITCRTDPRAVRTRRVASFAGGLALVLAPVALRNAIVGGEFALTTSQAGSNFYIGNNPRSDGTYAPLRPGRGDTQFERRDAVDLAEQATGRKLTSGEVSRYWFGQSFAFIAGEPGKFAALLGRKAALLVNAYEVPDAEDLYFYERYSSVLRALGFVWSFGILVPLAAAGIALAWNRRRELAALLLVIATLALGVVAFYVFARYRYPLVPALMLFAGAGLVELFDRLRAKRAHRLAAPALVLVAAGLASNVWRPYSRDAALAASWRNSGVALGGRGEHARAAEMFLEALKLDPRSTETWSNLGVSYLGSGRAQEAADAFRKAIELHAPDLAREHERLAEALTRLGRWNEAAGDLHAVIALAPANRAVRVRLAWLLATAPDDHARNGAEALRLAQTASDEVGGRDMSALDALAAAQAELGHFDEAVATLDKLLQAADAQRQLEAAQPIRARRDLYLKKQPFRQGS